LLFLGAVLRSREAVLQGESGFGCVAIEMRIFKAQAVLLASRLAEDASA